MPWGRALTVWLLIVAVESISGTLRELFLAPAVGELLARQIGFYIGVALVLGVSWMTAPWLGARKRTTQLAIGTLWMVLTALFEVGIGAARGRTWAQILAEFDPSGGGMMGFGLVLVLVAPSFGVWARHVAGARTPGL